MKYIIEPEAYRLLQNNNLPVPKYYFVKDECELQEAAAKIGYPAAMKIVSEDIIHKSDVGGVKLNITDFQALKSAYNEIMCAAEKVMPGGRHHGVLLTQMIEGGVETIIGLGTDQEFGRYLMFGLGGIYVEIYKDVSFRILPLSKADAVNMIEEVKGSVLLKGYRGSIPKNIDALVDFLMKCSELALENPNIREMDLNPVMVREDGVFVLDARVFVESKS